MQDPTPEWKAPDEKPPTHLVVTRSMSVTYRVPITAYQSMTVDQAIAYERNLPKRQAVENIQVATEDVPDSKLMTSCAVRLSYAPVLEDDIVLSGPVSLPPLDIS
jgi:hypothetical protein